MVFVAYLILAMGLRKRKVVPKVEGLKLNAREAERIKVEAVVLERSRWIYANFPSRLDVFDKGLVANKKNCIDAGINDEKVQAKFEKKAFPKYMGNYSLQRRYPRRRSRKCFACTSSLMVTAQATTTSPPYSCELGLCINELGKICI